MKSNYYLFQVLLQNLINFGIFLILKTVNIIMLTNQEPRCINNMHYYIHIEFVRRITKLNPLIYSYNLKVAL